MNRHKTGCNRCHKSRCCCPRVRSVSSCVCPPGPQGPAGPQGPEGASGAQGLPGVGHPVLAFSGLINAAANTTTYFANGGRDVAADLDPHAYPVDEAFTLETIAANVDTALPDDAVVVVSLMRNGAPTGISVTYEEGDSGILVSSNGAPVEYLPGDTYGLTATVTGAALTAGTSLLATAS